MNIVQINSTCGTGSTGNICVGISRTMTCNGFENRILYNLGQSDYPLGIKCSQGKYIKGQALISYLLGNYGFNSALTTKKIIGELNRLQPDIVHLHNIHSHDCNLETLFKYFKENHIKLLWTFHDCWAFTAYCPHFTMAHCDKWKSGCCECVQAREYSFFFDRSRELYEKKKALFSGLDLTIVTPSQWLYNLVKKSFLKDYPVKIINNGIDLSVFKQTESDFRKSFNCENKKVLLGVAFDWGKRKGLDVFIELSKRLDPSEYKIVLVGTNKRTDKDLPEGIISIHKTQNRSELAKIYTSADLFVNPTREEVLGLVNIEANACGTPVLTFKTGGSPETLDSHSGTSVACGDINAMEREIKRICTETPFNADDCIKRAREFDMAVKFQEYVDLYKSI